VKFQIGFFPVTQVVDAGMLVETNSSRIVLLPEIIFGQVKAQSSPTGSIVLQVDEFRAAVAATLSFCFRPHTR